MNPNPDLLATLKAYVAMYPAFRHPIGAPHSIKRIEQDAQIALEDAAKKYIAAAEGRS